MIDTRGIDKTAARADLENLLLDPHTVAILCSGFNDAPSQSVQNLLQRARDIENPLIDSHLSILVLPRPDEALAVKDEIGMSAETDQEGYDLKAEQIVSALAPLGLQQLPVGFFNSRSDDPQWLHTFILERVRSTRNGFRDELRKVIESAQELLENLHKEKVLADQREAGRHVVTWLEQHSDPPGPRGHVHDALLTAIAEAYVSTVNATVRREGEWHSLSYSHQLGHGARRVAVSVLQDWLIEFRAICQNLAQTHHAAGELPVQAERLMDLGHEDLLKKMQVAGGTLYREELHRAQTLWRDLNGEWGQGSGYRQRVVARQGKWFDEDGRAAVEQEILDVLHREWSQVRRRVGAIFDRG